MVGCDWHKSCLNFNNILNITFLPIITFISIKHLDVIKKRGKLKLKANIFNITLICIKICLKHHFPLVLVLFFFLQNERGNNRCLLLSPGHNLARECVVVTMMGFRRSYKDIAGASLCRRLSGPPSNIGRRLADQEKHVNYSALKFVHEIYMFNFILFIYMRETSV